MAPPNPSIVTRLQVAEQTVAQQAQLIVHEQALRIDYEQHIGQLEARIAELEDPKKDNAAESDAEPGKIDSPPPGQPDSQEG